MQPPPIAVTVTLNGTIVASSVEAVLLDGTVVAPLSPFLDGLAARYATRAGGTIVIEGGGRRVTLALGDRNLHLSDRGSESERVLTLAPRVRAGNVLVPLAAVARALGYSARFEASATPVLALERGERATLGPAAPQTVPPGPYVTFAPRTVATPVRPVPPIVPQPRRTPIHEIDGPTGSPAL